MSTGIDTGGQDSDQEHVQLLYKKKSLKFLVFLKKSVFYSNELNIDQSPSARN